MSSKARVVCGLAVLCLLVFAVPSFVLAQSKPASKPKAGGMDELARKTIDRFKGLYYTVDVKNASCKGKVEATNPMTGAMTAEFTYTWDGNKGDMKFSDPMAGRQVGLGADAFDSLFSGSDWQEGFESATLTARQEEDKVIIDIESSGKDAALKSATFNAEGLMESAVMDAQGGGTGNMTIEYHKIGDKHSPKKFLVSMNMQGQQLKMVRTYEFIEVEGKTVYSAFEQSMDMGIMKMSTKTTVTDYKFDSAAGEGEPTSKPKE